MKILPLRTYSAASHQTTFVSCEGAVSVDVALDVVDIPASHTITAKVITSRRLGPQSSTSVSFGQTVDAEGTYTARVTLPKAVTDAALLIEVSGGGKVRLAGDLIPVAG